MQIKAIIHEVVNDRTLERTLELGEDATMQGLLDALGYRYGDFTDYDPFYAEFQWDPDFLPFLICDGRILYDVMLHDAKVRDFMRTHEISDNTLRVTTNYPQAGGFGVAELAELWEYAKPVLEGLAIFCTLSGLSVPQLVQRLRDKFTHCDHAPYVLFDIVYSRTAWNQNELAELLQIGAEDAQNTLRLFGYVYDPSQKQYVQGERVEEIKHRLMAIENPHY